MKNDFPLNSDFKAIIMLINENNYDNKDLKINCNENTYQIYSTSFIINENLNKKKEIANSNTNISNIYKYKNVPLPAKRNYENNQIILNFESKSSLVKGNNKEIENEKSKRSYDEKYSNKINNFINNKNKILIKHNIYNLNNNNHNSKISKNKALYIKENNSKSNRNKNSFNNLQNQELFYDSIIQSEYINSPKHFSNESSIQDNKPNMLISLNYPEIKDFQKFNNISKLNDNIIYNNIAANKRRSLNNNKNINLINSNRNNDVKKNKTKLNNNSNKNIYNNNFDSEYAKNERYYTNKQKCSTEMISYNDYYNYDNLYLKKYRTIKEINKGKKYVKSVDKFLFPLNNEESQEVFGNQNLYKDNAQTCVNNPKEEIDLFKEYLKIRKKKFQNNNLNNNLYNNYNSHKFEKKNNQNKLKNEYRIIQQKNINRQINYSPSNYNNILITSKNEINRNNTKLYPKEHSYNNTNIKNGINNNNYINNSYNSNNVSGNNKQQQNIIPSTMSKNRTINTGFKIKNLNINYFNIMQPNELFFNHQRNRTKSRPSTSNISNKNNYQANCPNSNIISKKYNNKNNLKTNKYLKNMNKNENSLFLMTDLIDVKKIKDNMRKQKNGILAKFRFKDFNRHNESCLSNDIKRPNMNINEPNKIRISKQSIRLINRDSLNSLDNNKNGIIKKNFIENFSNSNNKQIAFIKIHNLTSKNNSKKNSNNRFKVINKKISKNKNINENQIHKSLIINKLNKERDNYEKKSNNISNQTFIVNNKNKIIVNENNIHYQPNNNFFIHKNNLTNYK